MELKANIQFYQCQESDKFLIIHEGGTRSGKTYSILQYLFFLCLATDAETDRLRISIVRKWLPSLKRSAYRDFLDILRFYKYYDEGAHNKSDLIYELEGHTIEFFAVGDEPDRLRSVGRDILYINEALELNEEEYRQLKFRTTKKIIADYNPSEPDHFLYHRAEDEDADLFITTYRDNNFLSDRQIKSIEEEKERNPNAWKVYGLGERASILKGKIYSGWEKVPEFPDNMEIFYGLDFGFHPDPTALLKMAFQDETLYIQELAYSTRLMEEDIIRVLNPEPNRRIYCDHNQPQIIEALRRAGFDAVPAKKGAGSLVEGINFLKRMKVYVVDGSNYTWKEYNSYQWKKKRGFDADDADAWEQIPEDKNNHAMDAARIGIYSHYFVGKEFFVL